LSVVTRGAEAERAEVAAFRRRLGLTHLIDVHTHFMPERVLAKVWAYFEEAGPLVGRGWRIAYRLWEQQRLDVLRGFGVRAFTSLVYPHKPGMARWLNDWAAEFAARTSDCLHTATFFAEPSAPDDVRRALDQGARVFKCHLQVGGYDPNDPLLREAWGLLAEAGVPGRDALRVRAGARCLHRPRAHRRPARPTPPAAVGRRAPRDAGVPRVPRSGRTLRLGHAGHHHGVHPVRRGRRAVPTQRSSPPGAPRRPHLARHRLPNIPCAYARALQALEHTGLGTAWLRAVCHDNAARLFAR
jgi:hypothetical protein